MAYDIALPNRKRQRTLFESVNKESQKKAQISEPDDTPGDSSALAARLPPGEKALTPESNGDYVDDTFSSTQTELGEALPPVDIDQEATDDYESSRVPEGTEPEGSDAIKRYDQRKWVKGRSSIYVDAFNLALDSVLADEAHLFDESEMALFGHWKDLCYESQYLYVV